MYLLGLDIGGTKVEAALLQVSKSFDSQLPQSFETSCFRGALQVLSRCRIPSHRMRSYDEIIQDIGALCRDVIQKAGVQIGDVQGLGLGVPGTMDPLTQRMINGNSLVFRGQPIGEDLVRVVGLDCPSVADNDANCFAYAEGTMGALYAWRQEHKVALEDMAAIGFILGTGVGGGCFLQGKIFRGAKGGGGEVGHMNLVSGGFPCFCGLQGCAEQYLSGPGIEALYGNRMYAQIKTHPTAAEIFSLAAQFEPVAIAVVQEYRRHLAQFITNLAQLFDPHCVVLGGGVSTQSMIYEGLEEEVARQRFVKSQKIHVLKHQLGDSAGVLGAALLPLH